MSDTATQPTVLEGLEEQYRQIGKEWDEAIEEREKAIAEFEQRQSSEKDDEKPTDEERDAHGVAEEEADKAYGEFDRRSKQLEARIGVLRGKEERLRQGITPEITVRSEPLTYREDNSHEYSYYRDLLATHPLSRPHAPRGADERVQRHAKETEVRIERKIQQERRDAEQGIDEAEREFRGSLKGVETRGLDENPFEKRANPSRETGHGSEFVPPLWLVEDDWIPALRAGRVIAPLCRNLPVPPGTDVVKVPKIKTGTEVAPQLADNAPVASRDIETTFVEAPIKTLAGQEDYAIQLVEQSPGRVWDRVVQTDILAAYNLNVEEQVAFGSGTNVTQLNAGTILGLYPSTNWGGKINESTTAASFATFIAAMNCNWSWIAKERFDVSNVHHVIHPRRAAWFASLTEAASETGPLAVNSTEFANFNRAALLQGDAPAQGLIFETPLGPNAYATVNIPPEDDAKGKKVAGQTSDFCLTAKWDDVWFFESDLRTRVLPEVLSGTLQIRYQVYAYVGLLVRYGKSLAFAVGKTFETPKVGGFTF